MDKRTRLQNTIAGQSVDRIPIALWRHFPGDDQRAADFARSIMAFQNQYDWDFITISPASTYPVVDYALQTAWQGRANGDRTITKHAIERSLDWTDLRALDPQRGEPGKMLECIRLVSDELQEDVPIIMTVYSPLAQAERLCGRAVLLRHLRTHPDRLRSGLNMLTENTLRLLTALKRTPIAGIRYVVEHAEYDALSEDEYRQFGIPYDAKLITEAADNWWLNILQLQGDAPMFTLVKDYQVQAVNWHTFNQRPNLPQGKSLILGAVCGGLSSWDDLYGGTPTAIRSTTQDAIQLTNGRRLILGAEGPIPLTAPLSNLRAARAAVQTRTESV